MAALPPGRARAAPPSPTSRMCRWAEARCWKRELVGSCVVDASCVVAARSLAPAEPSRAPDCYLSPTACPAPPLSVAQIMEVKEQAERKIAQLHTRIQQLESKVGWAGVGGKSVATSTFAA